MDKNNINKPDQSYEASTIDSNTTGFPVPGHVGTWHAILSREVEGHKFWLMEHDTYGDDAAALILDEKGDLCLSNIYDGFDDHTVELLRQEVMPLERLPDPSITVPEMKKYGYAWGGMLPMRLQAAEEVMGSNACQIYLLYSDDTEGMAEETGELKAHAAQGGIFGVEKVEWIAFLEQEKNSLAHQIDSANRRFVAPQIDQPSNDKDFGQSL